MNCMNVPCVLRIRWFWNIVWRFCMFRSLKHGLWRWFWIFSIFYCDFCLRIFITHYYWWGLIRVWENSNTRSPFTVCRHIRILALPLKKSHLIHCMSVSWRLNSKVSKYIQRVLFIRRHIMTKVIILGRLSYIGFVFFLIIL